MPNLKRRTAMEPLRPLISLKPMLVESQKENGNSWTSLKACPPIFIWISKGERQFAQAMWTMWLYFAVESQKENGNICIANDKSGGNPPFQNLKRRTAIAILSKPTAVTSSAYWISKGERKLRYAITRIYDFILHFYESQKENGNCPWRWTA